MPMYPAVALLLGSAMAVDRKWLTFVSVSCIAIAVILFFILVNVWQMPAPGDIYTALSQHPDLYTLSLGHMADLTMPAFAYLKLPAGDCRARFIAWWIACTQRRLSSCGAYVSCVFSSSAVSAYRFRSISFVVFRSASVKPPSERRADCLRQIQPVIVAFFYSNYRALQNEDDLDILEYGSLAPGAPKISVSDNEMRRIWNSSSRVYIVAKARKMQHIADVLGNQDAHVAFRSGDKYLLVNQ